MAALVTLSWDVAAVDGGARRPSLADVGSALLEDKGGSAPPKTGTHPYADMFNQGQKQLAAIGRMLPSVKLTILATGAARDLLQIQAAGLSISPTGSDFPLVRDSAGVTRIQWTSTKIPNPTCWPEVTVHGTGIHGCSSTLALNTAGAGAGVATPGTHRIIVTTHTGGVAADLSFTVSIN